jgi:4-amino-4-deoxy-L-arabinose transferase-like glycosyltransferase
MQAARFIVSVIAASANPKSSLFLHQANDVLTYRFPAAIISVCGVAVLYLTVRRFAGKKAAFWAALALLRLPLHLYFSRTNVQLPVLVALILPCNCSLYLKFSNN